MSSHASSLRRARERSKLSLEGLARRAGISTATVWRAEQGRHKTTDENWAAIAQALGVKVEEIHVPEADSASTGRGENANDGAGRVLGQRTLATGAGGE